MPSVHDSGYPSACWIGMHEGRIAATDKSLGRLIARMKKNGIAVEEATFRFVSDRDRQAGSADALGQRT